MNTVQMPPDGLKKVEKLVDALNAILTLEHNGAIRVNALLTLCGFEVGRLTPASQEDAKLCFLKLVKASEDALKKVKGL